MSIYLNRSYIFRNDFKLIGDHRFWACRPIIKKPATLRHKNKRMVSYTGRVWGKETIRSIKFNQSYFDVRVISDQNKRRAKLKPDTRVIFNL